MTEIGRALADFLPLRLLGRLHRQNGRRPAAVEFAAAVLFVDVSRYTALVEQSARRGQEGLEQIPRILSLSYARCVDHVLDNGGEVLSFIGDTVQAYWPSDDRGLAAAVRAAKACAEAICRDAASASKLDPALHVGVGAGRFWAVAAGGLPVWNLIAGGEAVVQAAAAQSLARSWEYMLSDAAARVLAHGDVAEQERDPTSFEVVAEPPPRDWLIAFLPPPLQSVLRSVSSPSLVGPGAPVAAIDTVLQLDAGLEALAEIRPATVVFARISGLDPRGPPDPSGYQAICAALGEVLGARGGPSGELFIDDKGLIFVAAFGAQGSFHRDDPSRAIDAAHRIKSALQRLGLSVSIGVATGDAFFGIVGSRRRRQLMVVGAPINRAARLMMSVSDDVLCDAPTERASRATFWFEKRGSLQLDGLGDVTAVFRPTGPRAAVQASSTLIGRQRELDVMKDEINRAGAGGSRLLVILGEPGIGKSALVTAFMAQQRAGGARIAVARAERDDRRTSLLPWRRLLASLLGLSPDADGAVILAAMRARVQSDATIVGRLPLLSDVLGVDMSEPVGTRHLQGPHRADATMRLLSDLIGHLGARPLTLILEDSQWLDSASWRLIEWMLGSLSSILLILCVRSEEVPDQLMSLQRRTTAAQSGVTRPQANVLERFCRFLNLDELDEDSISELVARTLGGAPPHYDLARTITSLAGGNPFFAEEIALTLKGDGLIAVRDGYWQPLRPLDSLRYFEGVERVIRERVDRLSAKAIDMLKAAAVIGRSFRAEPLAILLNGDTDPSAIEDLIETLVVARFFRTTSEPGRYAFRHDQIRDVVYGSISGDVRQNLHGRLADWLESRMAGATGADFALLVQHFAAAGNTEKAVKYADLAATRALQVGASREVEAFLQICFSQETRQQSWTSEQRRQAVRRRRQLAEAHYSRGDIHAQGIAARSALSAAGCPVPRFAAATLVHLLSRVVRLAWQQAVPPSVKQARHDAQRRWEREIARCMNQASMVDYFELRVLRGMYNLVGAVTHAERAGDSIEMAVASAQLAYGLGIMGWQAACDHFMTKAEQVALALDDPAVYAHVCNVDALSHIGPCEWPTVDRRLDQAQELCVQAGDQLSWCNAQGMRFWSRYYRGDRTTLEPTALALLARAQNSGNIQQEIWALRCKALCALHADSPREAAEILRHITSAMHGSIDLAAQISSQGVLALAHARIGQHGESVHAVVETLHLLQKMRRPSSHSTLAGISGIAEVLLRGREAGLSRSYEEWGDWERQALRELDRYRRVFPLGTAQFGMWSGVAHWLDGRKPEAIAIWERALEIARRCSLRQDETMIIAEMRRRQD